MESFRYVRAIIERIWLVALLAVVGAATAWYVSSLQVPQYEATVTMLVNPASPSALIPYLGQPGSGGSAPIPALVASYSEYLKSRTFTELVVQRLGPDLSRDQVARSVRTALVPSTNMFKLSVTWSSPDEAARIANGIAELFVNDRPSPGGQATQTAVPEPTVSVEVATAEEYRRRSAEYYRQQSEELRALVEQIRATDYPTTAEKVATLDRAEQRLQVAEGAYARFAPPRPTVAAVPTPGRDPARQSWLDSATILDVAIPPSASTGPSPLRNMIFGAVSGLALGIGLAMLLEYLDQTVRTNQDIIRITGAAALGAITRLRKSEVNPVQLLGPGAQRSTVAEAYRMVRTNIQFETVNRPCSTLLVTSPAPGEGKSTTAANLAVVNAQAGKRVILIDADLRRPNVHRLFDVTNERGLSDLLVDPDPQLELVLQETAQPGLRLITSGPIPARPVELLQSPRFNALLSHLTTQADLVLIDSPPTLGVADAAVLGTQCDGVIVIIESGRTRNAALDQTMSILSRGGSKLVGVVVNKLSRRGEGYYYYRYYGSGDSPKRSSNGTTPHSNGTATVHEPVLPSGGGQSGFR